VPACDGHTGSRACVSGRTEVRLVGTTLQLHSFGAALDQEVPHQLVGDVTCNGGEGAINTET